MMLMLMVLPRLRDRVIINILITALFISSCKGSINKESDTINSNTVLSVSNDSLIFQKKWTDKLGENIFKIRKYVNYEANEGENIFKLSFSLENSSGIVMIKDSILDCPVETDLNFLSKSFNLSDIDNNGFKEMSFMYNKYCRGDISGDDLFLFCIENNNKWFVKGGRTNKAFIGSDYYDGFGEILVKKVPEKLKKNMVKNWLKHSNEDLIHSDSSVDEKYEILFLKKKLKSKYTNLSKNQNISKKWQGKYHYLDEEGRTAGGDWTGHYTNYRITKDSVHLTTSGHMSGREDYYLAEEKGDTLMLYRYQDIRNNNSLYKQIEQEKLYKKGDTYYFLVNEQEKKGVKVE